MNHAARAGLGLAGLVLATAAHAAAAEHLPAIKEMVGQLDRRAGLMTIYLDEQRGQVFLAVPAARDSDEGHVYLYVEGLATGLGSNPVGLDRGQIGPARLVGIRRVGGRVLVEEKNLKFRALSDNPAERRAVRQAFARSVLWGGEIIAEDPDGRVLVDFTSFVVRDAHHSARTLEATGQGAFTLDKDRSALDPEACLAFPDNVEFEALLTFQGKKPGAFVRATVPESSSVTMIPRASAC
ncbi:MAG: DUF5117 domain-containing protein [Acidobacteriota bacterium]